MAVLEGDDIADSAAHAPPGHALRIHVSGDATTTFRAQQMARGAARWRGPVWSYTHAWRDVERKAWGRVSVLASCETLADVRSAHHKGFAAALVVERHPDDGKAFTAFGVKHIPCPSQTRDIKCTDCRLCWNDAMLLRQNACITFAAHGAGTKRTLTVLKNEAT